MRTWTSRNDLQLQEMKTSTDWRCEVAYFFKFFFLSAREFEFRVCFQGFSDIFSSCNYSPDNTEVLLLTDWKYMENIKTDNRYSHTPMFPNIGASAPLWTLMLEGGTESFIFHFWASWTFSWVRALFFLLFFFSKFSKFLNIGYKKEFRKGI